MKAPLVGLALVLLAGCSGGLPTTPTRWGMRLTVQVAPERADALHPAAISMHLTNEGPSRFIVSGCGVEYLEILDPEMARVHLTDPRLPGPECPVGRMSFDHGEELKGTLRFGGIVFDEDGTQQRAASGVYTAVARIWTYRDLQGRDPQVVERRVRFRWTDG